MDATVGETVVASGGLDKGRGLGQLRSLRSPLSGLPPDAPLDGDHPPHEKRRTNQAEDDDQQCHVRSLSLGYPFVHAYAADLVDRLPFKERVGLSPDLRLFPVGRGAPDA